MKLENFKRLHEIEQDEIVTNSGTYLMNYVEGDYLYDVYKLYQFYVIFSYDLSENKNQSISAFLGSEHLHLYIMNNSNALHN